MPNPLFNRFGQSQMLSPFQNFQNNGFMNMLQKFQQFRSTFQGDPRAQVQQLLDSGTMTQEQFNQFSNMAAQMRNMFN